MPKMNKWKEKKLEEICLLISRGISPQYTENGILIMNQKCIRDNKVDLSLCKYTNINTKISNEKFVQDGDIVVNSTGTGTLGRTAIFKLNIQVTVDSHITIIRPNTNVNKYYLGYFLHSIESIIENFGKGSTNQKELAVKDLKSLKVKFPDLSTQKRIVDILSNYDDLIENNNRRIALLENAAQNLYKEWFVHFRFPGYEQVKFQNGLPQGWKVNILGKFGHIETGKTPSTAITENYGDKIMFIKTPDMHNKVFIIETDEMLSYQGHKTQSKKLLPPNSIMVSCIGTGGVVAINAEKAHTNQQINSIILNDVKYLEWLYFSCKELKSTIELFGATGATMTNLSKGKFEKLKILNPPQRLIYDFNKRTVNIFNSIKNYMKQNQNLKKQRDLLLPRLMSGKLEV